LSTYGFSEGRNQQGPRHPAYRAGHFVVNAEHPMLMKLAMWGSVTAADRWNRLTPSTSTSARDRHRLPNAIAGGPPRRWCCSACADPLGDAVALVASLLWAFDVNAIAINRLGKGDTFSPALLPARRLCYEHAKRQGVFDASGAQRWYTASERRSG